VCPHGQTCLRLYRSAAHIELVLSCVRNCVWDDVCSVAGVYKNARLQWSTYNQYAVHPVHDPSHIALRCMSTYHHDACAREKCSYLAVHTKRWTHRPCEAACCNIRASQLAGFHITDTGGCLDDSVNVQEPLYPVSSQLRCELPAYVIQPNSLSASMLTTCSDCRSVTLQLPPCNVVPRQCCLLVRYMWGSLLTICKDFLHSTPPEGRQRTPYPQKPAAQSHAPVQQSPPEPVGPRNCAQQSSCEQVHNSQQATDNRLQTTGNRQQTTANRQQPTYNRQQTTTVWVHKLS
jgi:hypothetical protein